MSSQVLSGIATESDLSESERQALIAFKTALNERLPQILPETTGMSVHANANPQDTPFLNLLDSFVLNDARLAQTPALQELKTLYAALPEKAQARPLAENVAAAEVAALNGSERALAEFKQTLNERLPEILPATRGMSVHANGDTNDAAFSSLMERYVFNDALLESTPALSELRTLYQELPADIRAETETHIQYFIPPSTANGKTNQGIATVALAEKYLGTNDSAPETQGSVVKIDSRTSRAIREELESLQQSEQDIDIEFDPRVFDQRAVDFLNAVVHKRMRDANAPESALEGMLVQLWALQNGSLSVDGNDVPAPTGEQRALGSAVSLLNVMKFMVNAELPSNSPVAKPEVDVTWDTQWTNNDSGDRFFNSYAYRDLYQNKTVTTDVLFDKPSYSEENYEILMRAAERLDIDMSRQRVMSEMEVGKIAIEIMSIRAQDAWCLINPDEPFDETKIHEMIHEGQFMPHIDDVHLAEKGFGVPETEWFRRKLEEYGPEGSYNLEYDERTTVLAHRARAFAERFGEMPDSAVAEKARLYSTSEDHIRHSYGTPSLYFGTPRGIVGSREPTRYERDRDVYLERYQAFKEDVGTCDPNATPDNENDPANTDPTNTNGGPCTVEGVLRGETFPDAANADETNCDCIKTNVEDATGNPQGDCTVEDELERRMSVENAPAN